MVADSQRHIGFGQWFGGRPHAAVATLRQSFAFSQQIENRWGQADCASRMTIPLAEIGRYGEAIRFGRLARAEVERLGEIVGNNRRYRLILLRSQAVLAQWDGDAGQAITHLQAALALAQEMDLPGEEWPIRGELGRLYGAQGAMVQAREAYQQAAKIIHRLAETIDEDGLREGFLTAVPVRTVLERNKATE